MAAAEMGYAIKCFADFDADINWRPTKVLSAIQRIHSCSLCGVVPSETKVLPCCHALCVSCYDALRHRHLHCPIEGSPFTESQVNSMHLQERHLLNYQVHCWNLDNGCQFVGSLLDVSSHFRNECSFHHVTCTRCHSYVLRRNILDHYEGGCKDEFVGSNPLVPDHILRSSKATESIMTRLAQIETSLEDSVSKLCRETSSAIREMKSTIAVQTRQLTELKEKQAQVHLSCGMSMDSLNTSVHGIPAVIRHRFWAKALVNSTVFNISRSKVCWVVTDVEKHLDEARHQRVQVVSDKFVLENYSARLCLKLVQGNGVISVHLFFNICRGPKDDDLRWPFNLPVRMFLVHPRDRLKSRARSVDPTSTSYPHCYYRPVEENNLGEGGTMIDGNGLDDFVVSNTLLVSAETRDTNDVT